MTTTQDITQILELLPHRYPMLLVDRVVEQVNGKYIKAYKNITFNEPFFTGHFPQKPIMPGVLILEALAQASGILAFGSVGKTPAQGSLYYLVGIDNARFKQPVIPGDRLDLYVEMTRNMRGIYKFTAEASVEGRVVAQAELMCTERSVP
ncbi:(3R)-hydroxymyristol acyl carrier protein dehydratase [Thiomonas arsenitoxydans]|jgi:3-hydroxyacyl-[acyl-carrier-protein] dehydratase|uniref:3-hydroxyacyl-[acyl-carrier-protein] dehydratase FabZ n=1 Tax=Thiomonas arsenitoxydans (strain DSM 22701 / CIP 110005 / 3As) TaxID=426114 RepID=D6CUW9_THIA3|nr:MULTISPECIES: 3-hydroxyacyl-ACP dehydratase FabZ [Thiomonas]MDE2173917.1 3-hydroxyacyl-ACP dehydratase FabZ [Betaproteobacteria bacterium]OZB71063.1 MAG: beta-hydroxyacyl-ACP dehydratase [Thiomonas sp. 13-64-67]CAZ89088.1 (3R)-hydroxymyristoyl-[acyl-carrier-protein] dehydratase ((3R)-hydroxymyristoyl ACP dehydrase) (17 kDa actomyosin component) [Thiomonas arsenitoxydans]CQR36530.1 (3R)-hydroxymyristol acyl carrier protein dehydratase [Thiomonas arsenitoxydans]CQR36561.1 (3R)-hydroxymyristol